MRVLVAGLKAGANPSHRMLYEHMLRAEPIHIEPYSRSAALKQRWDIIHIHWPEYLISRNHGSKRLPLECTKTLTTLAIAKRRGARIVWTAHNLRPHESDRFGFTTLFMHAFISSVDQVICASQTALDVFQLHYPALNCVPSTVIPTGDLRGAYPDSGLSKEQCRSKLGIPEARKVGLVFGRIRPYKNIPHILRCYEQLDRDDTFLLVAGRPMPESLGEELVDIARNLPSTRVVPKQIDENDVQYYMRASDFLVIATSYALNSAVFKLGLSFDRPVITPHRGAAIEFQDVAPEGWVHTYDGGMRASVLNRAFDMKLPCGTFSLPPVYSWKCAAERVLDTYKKLLSS